LGPDGHRCRDLVLALIVARILGPTSKLAAARALSPATAASSLGDVLALGGVDEDELYTALDWLLARQPAVEAALAKRHLSHGTLVLYDVSSSYMEGRRCPLAERGYSRDGRRGTLQIVYGLLCAADGCPVAIELFDGNTADPKTLAAQIDKLKRRFRLDHVVLVGDRGMITQARITEEVRAAEIALAVGAVIDTYKMAKHFDLTITDASFSFARKTTEIQAEAASDGLYVVRTSLPAEALDDAATVRSYKSLARVERAFRCIKTVDLQVRPVHHWLADRVRAHVFLCMLAYYVEWHMRQQLAPMLFDDTDKNAAEALRTSVVAQAQRSPTAVNKQTTGLTEDGL